MKNKLDNNKDMETKIKLEKKDDAEEIRVR